MNRFLSIAGKILVAGLLLPLCMGFAVPPITDEVQDLAQVFSDQQEAQIEASIRTIKNKTTVEIAILTVPSLEGEDIFDAGMRVAEEWKIGAKDVDNGLLLLISITDRKWRFFTGYGLEGSLPDVTLSRIGTEYFPLYFRNEEYSKGVEMALFDIFALLQHDPSVVSKYKKVPQTDSFEFLLPFMIAGAWLGALFYSLVSRPHRWKAVLFGAGIFEIVVFSLGISALITIPAIFVMWIFSLGAAQHFSSLSGGSDWGGRGGFSSSGGFSGFGGGSFGGGGAGGDW